MLLASFYDQNRIPVTYEQVAPILYDSILSSEDKTFYESGEEFDSSWSRSADETIQVPLGAGAVIPGFEQGIEGMKVGESGNADEQLKSSEILVEPDPEDPYTLRLRHGPTGNPAEAPILPKLPAMVAFPIANGGALLRSDGYIYGVDPYSRQIQSMYPMSYGAYSVGYPAPVYAGYNNYPGYGGYSGYGTGYPSYGVPSSYNQLYYGQPGYNYQYANGGIYQVDPTTQIVRALVRSSGDRYVSPFDIAVAYVGLGDTDAAFRWLERGYEEHAPGMDTIAITDHGCLFGVIEFYNECKKQGIKPIIGMEAYVAQGSRLDRTPGRGSSNHLVLLAKNETGYRNLMKLVSRAYLEGYWYKPRADRELLAER